MCLVSSSDAEKSCSNRSKGCSPIYMTPNPCPCKNSKCGYFCCNSAHNFQTPKSCSRTFVPWKRTTASWLSFGSQVSKLCFTASYVCNPSICSRFRMDIFSIAPYLLDAQTYCQCDKSLSRYSAVNYYQIRFYTSEALLELCWDNHSIDVLFSINR